MPHNERGQEIPDDTPVEIPAGMARPESLAEQMARLIAKEVADQAQAQGFDTWEEDEDFEDDDPNLLNFTDYEFTELQEEDDLPDPYPHHPPAQQAASAAPESPSGDSPEEGAPSGANPTVSE